MRKKLLLLHAHLQYLQRIVSTICLLSLQAGSTFDSSAINRSSGWGGQGYTRLVTLLFPESTTKASQSRVKHYLCHCAADLYTQRSINLSKHAALKLFKSTGKAACLCLCAQVCLHLFMVLHWFKFNYPTWWAVFPHSSRFGSVCPGLNKTAQPRVLFLDQQHEIL